MKPDALNKIILGCLLVLVALVGTRADRIDKAPADLSLPFGLFEELQYDARFSRLLVPGITIGELRFTAALLRPASTDSPRINRVELTADAVSKGFFTKVFSWRFHERIDSEVDPLNFTLLKNRKLDEQGKRKRVSETTFNQELHELKWTEANPTDRDRPPHTVSTKFEEHVQDLASVFYFLRMQSLEPGKSLTLVITDSGRLYHMAVKVIARGRMSTVLGNVPVVRVDPELFGNNLLIPGKGACSIWLTDDRRHIPVRSRITSDLGTLEVTLKRFKSSLTAKP